MFSFSFFLSYPLTSSPHCGRNLVVFQIGVSDSVLADVVQVDLCGLLPYQFVKFLSAFLLFD